MIKSEWSDFIKTIFKRERQYGLNLEPEFKQTALKTFSVGLLGSVSYLPFFLLFIYVFERRSEQAYAPVSRVEAGEREREEDRKREKKKKSWAGPMPSAESYAGFNLMTMRSRSKPRSRVGCVTNWAPYVPLLLPFVIWGYESI